METDDIVYCILLIVSLLMGHAVKIVAERLKRKLLVSIVGVVMIVAVCRRDCLHSFVTALVNAAIVTVVSYKWCHIVSFIWCFGYLAFFRTAHYFGLPQVLPHSNAVQLFLTLRLVGLAFEIHDSVKWRQNLDKSSTSNSVDLKNKYQNIDPSFVDIMSYSFCYIGLLTGPYYKYRTFHDMINNQRSADINSVGPTLARLKCVPIIAAAFLITSHYFSIKYVNTEEFYTERPFWYRLFYMVPMFIVFRTRLYVAWVTSECMCMTATLGAYPVASKSRCGVGPTDFEALDKSLAQNSTCHEDDDKGCNERKNEYDFETVHSLDIYGCELATTVREGMRAWNMTVQYWLATYVYKRLLFKSGPLRVAVTMTVSAFWHGIHPGYYLSFLTIPPNLVAEELMAGAFRSKQPEEGRAEKNSKFQLNAALFDWICWFFKMRSFDYMCMSFLLLGLYETVRYWYSIYFIVHIYIAVFIIIGLVYRPRRSKTEKDATLKTQ